MARLIDVIARGLRSAQPLASSLPNGSLYFVTDEDLIEQVVSAAWALYCNVTPGSTAPGGSDKNPQYNNAGAFGGVANNATATKKYLQQVSSGTPSLEQVSGADLVDASVTAPKLAATAVTPDTYGDATHVAQVTVDQQGRITAASEVEITGGSGSPGGSDKNIQYNNAGAFGGITNNATATNKFLRQVSSGTPTLEQPTGADLVDASVTAAKLAATAVTPDTYGDATHVAQVTIDQQGRITAAAEVEITGGGGGSVGDLLDVQFTRATSAESRANTTVQAADPTLVQAIGANEIWEVEYHLRFESASATPDAALDVTAPAGATTYFFGHGPAEATTDTGNSLGRFNTTLPGSVQKFGLINSSSYLSYIYARALVINAGNTGNISLTWAQGTSNGTNTTRQVGSYQIARRYA